MAFTPSIDYVGHQTLRQKALGDVTRAKYTKKLKDEAEARRVAAEAAAAAAKRSRKVGMGRKIVGAIARGAAAYYTGGASEASGMGRMIDQEIQGGKDKEVNEYGEMVGAASTMSGMMTAKKVGDATTRLNAQSAKDDAMQERMDKISVRAGLDYAQKREAKDARNRKVFDEYKGGFLNFGKDIDGLDLSATTMDYSGISKGKKIETTATPVDTSPSSAYSPVSQLSTLANPQTDSGGTSTLLTEEQKDLFRGPREPEPAPAVPTTAPQTTVDPGFVAPLQQIDENMTSFREGEGVT